MNGWGEFKVALATYAAAPDSWIDGVRETSADAAQWTWEVIQGDFNDGERSTAQIVTGTVISMIPLVDQVCDVRDLVANCKKLHREPGNGWYWFALALTLIGLFPVLGSLAKGCFKILIAYARRGIGKGLRPAGVAWDALAPFVEAGIVKLNDHLNTAVVRKTLATLRIVSPYGWLAKQARQLSKAVSTAELLKAFDLVHGTTRGVLDKVGQWGTAALRTRAGALLRQIGEVRGQANHALGKLVRPLQHWLDSLAQRLEQEEAKAFKATTNTVNVARWTEDAEKARFDKEKPVWVDKNAKLKFPGEELPPANADELIAKGYPSGIKRSYDAFHDTPMPSDYPAGTVLYRIVDPTDKSFDNAPWWMTRQAFEAVANKDAWRRNYAVWQNWNGNGEYVTYVVPEGPALKGWRGMAATQKLNGASEYSLEGGAQQILLDPAALKRSSMQKRKPTKWGYDLDGMDGNGPLGIPVLRNNWREPK